MHPRQIRVKGFGGFVYVEFGYQPRLVKVLQYRGESRRTFRVAVAHFVVETVQMGEEGSHSGVASGRMVIVTAPIQPIRRTAFVPLGLQCASVARDVEEGPMTTPYPTHPQLMGNFAPIRMECDIDDVIVRGELPADLDITYYPQRSRPAVPAPRRNHHWFAGDGMLHMFRIRDGRVRYRNRWARTVKWTLERREGRSLYDPFNPPDNDPITQGVTEDGLANTNIVWHGGKLLALEEGHPPFEVEPQTLDSIGPWRFDDRFEGPMTAHPKSIRRPAKCCSSATWRRVCSARI